MILFAQFLKIFYMKKHLITSLFAIFLAWQALAQSTEQIPLPEHPRPDFQRPQWLNLNGPWAFRFDPENQGEHLGWHTQATGHDKQIMVPFPWGAPLSEVNNEAEIGWYRRQLQVPTSWRGKRIFLVIGASDWKTDTWLDGMPLGSHQGGYTPFEFELTDLVEFGKSQRLDIKVDDTPQDFKLYGKQGYGEAKGIWQTVYLEARGADFIKKLHFTPDIDRQLVKVKVELNAPLNRNHTLALHIQGENQPAKRPTFKMKKGSRQAEWEVPMPDQKLWSLEHPHLYNAQASLMQGSDTVDQVHSYFGMRKISVVDLPGSNFPYVALNNKPVYLELTLDQAYHPEGFYTFPTDAFVRDEILRTKKLGLNGQRVHVKTPIPRKLYWADRLGVLIMADVPNSWGEPDAPMRSEIELALRELIARDYNHPSVFSWIIFNETWGLQSKTEDGEAVYADSTKTWVKEMYQLAKQLDGSRLVEDNSANREDHVVTDLNTWHAYLPHYAWHEALDKISENTYPGSPWNFAEGYTQGRQPNLNSECGNVWGYEGSTGDVDISWDYHVMMNAFRTHPKIAGWLFTEHHDVINEWNGYYRYDRSDKYTGMEELADGMSWRDLHSEVYLAPRIPLCSDRQAAERLAVPLYLSVMTDHIPAQDVTISGRLYGWNTLGEQQEYGRYFAKTTLKPWYNGEAGTMNIVMPDEAGLAILVLETSTASGHVLQRNFVAFNVEDEAPAPTGRKTVSFAPASFARQQWSGKQWDVLDGLKVNGAGTGFFEYEVAWPSGWNASEIGHAVLKMELSAKKLLGKDVEGAEEKGGDYMRGKGFHDPGKNANAYPMTDDQKYPSLAHMVVNGHVAGEAWLPDDPADHRGILSWHAQLEDKKLREAGTYGYLVSIPIQQEALAAAQKAGKFIIRLAADEALSGGLAIYGRQFGRYPLDPTIVISSK